MCTFVTLGHTFGILFASFILHNVCLPLWKNIRLAKSTGLRYVVVPYYHYNFLTALLMKNTLLRIANWFSSPSVTSWRVLVTPGWPLKLRHAPFKAFGTDTFLTVSPGGIIFNTADADVISQVLARGGHFPKPTEVYKSIEIYGKNVVSSDGMAWRYHRKLTSPAFTEKNNHLVWKETLDRTQSMLSSFLGSDGKIKTVEQISQNTMRLSLEVIGRAGLGEKLEWPTDSAGSDTFKREHCLDEAKISFTASLDYITTHMMFILMIRALPAWLLNLFPQKYSRKPLEAYKDWETYMREMISAKRSAMKSNISKSAPIDLIGQLLNSQNDVIDGEERRVSLTDSEVLGNLFVFIIAGHETSASSIHFSLLHLALHPQMQKDVQKELGGISQGRQVSEWDYEKDLPQLLNSLIAAVMNETLRLISPVLTIPKIITSPDGQDLWIDGKQTLIPAKTLLRLSIPSVHRNPKFWPVGPPTNTKKPVFPLDNLDNDLEEFKPARWLRKQAHRMEENDKDEASDLKYSSSHSSVMDESTHLYNPIKGSFIPFSDGQRSCLGRRFAYVEILAALAVIFSEYSVELAVDEWASDEQVEQMTFNERKSIWTKAQEKAHSALQNKMVCFITVQLHGVSIPLRFVKKGNERFFAME